MQEYCILLGKECALPNGTYRKCDGKAFAGMDQVITGNICT